MTDQYDQAKKIIQQEVQIHQMREDGQSEVQTVINFWTSPDEPGGALYRKLRPADVRDNDCGCLTQIRRYLTKSAGIVAAELRRYGLPLFPVHVSNDQRDEFLAALIADDRIPCVISQLQATDEQLDAFAEWQRRWDKLCELPETKDAA